MATLTFTLAAGSEGGAMLRQLANQLDHVAAAIPDKIPNGGATTVVIDNAPSAGSFSLTVTGPYTTGPFGG